MRIVFDHSTLRQADNASRAITGVLYFDFSGFCFPTERWNDFAVVVTALWLEAVEKLERGIQGETLLRFIDGSYCVTLTWQGGDTTLLRCTEDRRNAGVVYEERIALPQLSAQVKQLAKEIAWACSRAGIPSSDLHTLRKYLPN